MSTSGETPKGNSGPRPAGQGYTGTTPAGSQLKRTSIPTATLPNKTVIINGENSIIITEMQETINNIEFISLEINKNSIVIRDKINDEVTAHPSQAFIIALLISAFCILACFIIIFITLLKTPTKTDLQIPPLDSKDQEKVDNKKDIDTIKNKINNLPDIIINKIPANKTSISDQDLNKLKDAYKDANKELNAGGSKPPDLIMITNKINSIEDLVKSTKISQEELKNSNKKLYDLSEKESNTSKELEKAKKELKDIKSKKIVNKSLLIVFAASTQLHLTEEISKEINEFFKNESESRVLGFQRAFSVLRQETLEPIVRFNQDQVGIIRPLIANEDAVNLNLEDVLKKIRDENLNSKTANKEILVLAGAEGDPPNPDPNNSVFKDCKQSVNIVLVARPGFKPNKNTYENWIKWASNNHATITWIFDDPSTKIDHQIVSIIKKSMGKDLGF